MVAGVITTRDVLRHAPLILREYGAAVLYRAVRAILTGRRVTFLALAFGTD